MIAQHARTALVVVLITAIIWVFAEGASLQRRSRRVDVSWAAPPASARAMRVADTAWSGEVNLSLEGSTASLDRLERLWLEPMVLEPGQPGVPTTAGTHTVELREVLRMKPEIRDSGVSVVRCDPATVVLEVDEVVSLPARVDVSLPESEPDAEAVATPQGVTLRVPRSVAARLGGAEARVIARVDAATLASAMRGRPETVRRVLVEPAGELAGASGVEIEPARLDVTVTLRSRTASLILPTVPVVIEMSALDQSRWSVTVAADDQVLRDVRVTGPADLVAAIERGETRVVGVVSLSFEDLENRVGSKRAEFSRLPTLLRLDAEDRIVELTIERRASSEPEEGP